MICSWRTNWYPVVLISGSSLLQPGFVLPDVTDSGGARIIADGARHPVVFARIGDQYVPNDIHLDSSSEHCMVITGPNMGGKSSFMRMTALLSILAQVCRVSE